MRQRLENGFTLIELMIVVAIVSILAALAAPSLRTTILNGRLATETNDLMTDLAFARSEAGRRGKRIAICIRSTDTACGTGTNWQSGRLVFVEETGGTAGSRDSGEEILRISQASSNSTTTIVAASFTNSGGTATTNYLQYRPSGALNSTTRGTFKICDERSGSYGRLIEIEATGRAALKKTDEICP